MTVTTASTITVPSEPMVGDELLSFVKKNGHLSKTEMAQSTGYVSQKKDGNQRCNFTAMTDALVEATGIIIGKGASQGRGLGGRKLSYKAVVQGNRNLLIGKAYTAQMDLNPGDEFLIKLNAKSNTIRLIPAGAEVDETDA